MSDNKKNGWFHTLNDQISSLAEEFGLDDIQINRFRDFMVDLAKEQYKIGNKSGIAWAYKQVREKAGQTAGVAPRTV